MERKWRIKLARIFQGQMIVSGGYLITKFDLTQAYPNPFRGSVKISFDVPTIAGASQQAIEINVYDLKGSLVKQLASGKYQAGHYTVAWNCTEGREVSMGSSVYIVRMKATNFDKRLKLLRVQ
jgi:flagellar hook assembly protein FlgD